MSASAKERYEYTQSVKKEFFANPMVKIFVNQEKRYVKPFRIYGNVWYVGDDWVCIHLIDTGDGLILIDSGNCGNAALTVECIWEAGFRPQDVKWIISSHGHVDHVGGCAFFKNMWGTKLYLADADAAMFREKPEFAFIQDSLNLTDDIFVPDVEIHEGDVLQLGNTTISCRIVPGHTEGCVALFFDAYDGDDVKRCGYYGGFGFNTMTKEALAEYGDPECRMWQTYEESIDKVIGEKVDIFLGNHTENNKTLEKYEIMKNAKPGDPNPFIDPEEWARYLGEKKEELHAFIKGQQG